MAHNGDTRARFLQILADTPFVNQAAKKVGVSRAQIYRWKKDNKEFREEMDKALAEGRENLIEVSEMSLVKKIRDGDTGATKYFLAHNSERYKPMRAAYPPPAITQEMHDAILTMNDFVDRNQPMPRERWEGLQKILRKNNFIDDDGQLTQKYREWFGDLIGTIERDPKLRRDIDW